ncbi:MAG: pyridoxal phosphate-dependent decarboxylase family protein, partial [Candidatus Limnocylindrales bacterium]
MVTGRTGESHTTAEVAELDTQQRSGMGDMDVEDFRAAAHAAVDIMADYLRGVGERPVMPQIEPGSLRPLFPALPPEEPEPIGTILEDYRRLFEPNVTHWQHPRFLAYFSSSASGPGIIGEMLTAVLNSNPMLWRTSPAGTELEMVVVDWLRQGLGLPPEFDGLLTDTASTSSLLALAAARQAAGIDAAAKGLPGRVDVPQLRVYASAEAHSSIEKACMTLGLGRAGLSKIPTNESFEMRTDALEEAIAQDRKAGVRPVAIVGTVGTTSTTSSDPIAELALIARREGLWLHVDAAYAGAVALIPERRGPFAGWEEADSIVTNPHKWFFTPVDASLLLTRRMEVLRDAFSLVPEYLRTLDRDGP